MSRRKRPLIVSLILAAVLAGPSCRREATQAQAPTAAELWELAEEALAAGDADQAANLFDQSLALEEDSPKRRSAAIGLLGAARLDLAEALVAGRADPHLAALARAIAAYQAEPPADRGENPYVIVAMADALLVRAAAPPAAPLERPLLLTRADLALAAHYWQAWLWCRQAEAGGDLEGRWMALWRLDHSPAAPAAGSVVQADPDRPRPAVLVHQGSSPLGLEGTDDELLVPGAGESPAPATLHLAAWASGQPATVLMLEGRWTDEALEVNAASDAGALQMVTDALADPDLSAAGATMLGTPEEAQAVALLAERCGYGARLARQGQMLSPAGADPESVDDGGPTQWLRDLVSYVRHARQIGEATSDNLGR